MKKMQCYHLKRPNKKSQNRKKWPNNVTMHINSFQDNFERDRERDREKDNQNQSILRITSDSPCPANTTTGQNQPRNNHKNRSQETNKLPIFFLFIGKIHRCTKKC